MAFVTTGANAWAREKRRFAPEPPRAAVRQAIWLLLLVVSCLPLGCKPAGPVTAPVFGTMTWNGQPLPAGYILFASEDGRGVPDQGRIVQGRYRLQVKPGKKKVEICAVREEGKMDPVMHQVPRQQYLPSRYNTTTQLRADVQMGKENRFDFTLTDK